MTTAGVVAELMEQADPFTIRTVGMNNRCFKCEAESPDHAPGCLWTRVIVALHVTAGEYLTGPPDGE